MIDVAQNNRINVTRGDTFSVPLFLNKGTDLKPMRYTLKEEDELYLAIMEYNQSFEDAIVKKTFSAKDLNKNGDAIIELDHDDTRCLVPGKYFYQIKAKLYNIEKEKYEINTVIQKTEFYIED